MSETVLWIESDQAIWLLTFALFALVCIVSEWFRGGNE